MRSLARFLRVNDPEALDETFRSHARIFQDIPAPAAAGIKMVKDFLGQSDPQIARLNADDIIEMRYADRLRREMGPGK
jgi:hypothetical protein